MKKLISIGVVLALVAIAVLPIGVAAQEVCDYEGVQPATYAKIPFAIVESGFALVGALLDVLVVPLELPTWLDSTLMETIGGWAGGPLSWSVDMLGWGLALVGGILTPLTTTLGLPDWLPGVINDLACGMFQPFSCNVSGAEFIPCP